MDSYDQLKLGRESYPNSSFNPICWRKKYASVDRIYVENKGSVPVNDKPPSYANIEKCYYPEVDHRPSRSPVVRLRKDEEEREPWPGLTRPLSSSKTHYHSMDPVPAGSKHSSVHATQGFSVVSRNPYVQILRTRVPTFPEQPFTHKYKVRTYHLGRRKVGLSTYGSDQASLNGEITPFGTKFCQPVFRKTRPQSLSDRKTASFDLRCLNTCNGQHPSQRITKLSLRESGFRVPKLSRSLSEDLGYRSEVQVIFVDELDKVKAGPENSSPAAKHSQNRPVTVPLPVAHTDVQCQAELTEPVHTIVPQMRETGDTGNPRAIWMRGQQPSDRSRLELPEMRDAIGTYYSFPYILPVYPNRLGNVSSSSRSSITPTPMVNLPASVQSRTSDYNYGMEESDQVAILTPDDSSAIADDLYVVLDNDVFDPYERVNPTKETAIEPKTCFATQRWTSSPNETDYVKRVTITRPLNSASFTCDAREKGPCRESGTTAIYGQESQYTPDDPYVELRGDFFCGRGRTEVHTIIAKRDTVYRIKTPVGYSFYDPDMSDYPVEADDMRAFRQGRTLSESATSTECPISTPVPPLRSCLSPNQPRRRRSSQVTFDLEQNQCFEFLRTCSPKSTENRIVGYVSSSGTAPGEGGQGSPKAFNWSRDPRRLETFGGVRRGRSSSFRLSQIYSFPAIPPKVPLNSPSNSSPSPGLDKNRFPRQTVSLDRVEKSNTVVRQIIPFFSRKSKPVRTSSPDELLVTDVLSEETRNISLLEKDDFHEPDYLLTQQKTSSPTLFSVDVLLLT